MNAQAITVVICTYNRAQSLARALTSLQEMSVPPDLSWELIVVDNNSHDDTRRIVHDFIRSSELPLRYVWEGTQGLCRARNTGIKEAKGEIVAFTDDDVTFDPHWLVSIGRAFQQYDCFGVGGKIVPLWPPRKPSWLETDGQYRLMDVIAKLDLGEEVLEMKNPPYGANMAFRSAAFHKYGDFRPDLDRVGYRLLGGGDTEFGRRLLRGGERVVYEPRAVVYHPVQKHRMTKGYFRCWYFNYGRVLVRVGGFPEEAARYAGIPRYLFRELLDTFLKSTFSVNSRGRFYHKLHCYQIAGQIIEAYLSSRSGRCGVSPRQCNTDG